MIPEKAFSSNSGKKYILGEKKKKKFSNVDELLHLKTDFESFMHAWRGACMGDGIRVCRVWNLSEQIRIRVSGVIHIHTGEGIGVGPFFGLFFHARVDTSVHTHRHTKNTHLPL